MLTQFGDDAPFKWGDGQQIWDRTKGPSSDDWVIVDHVMAPSEAGQYVLRWRWVSQSAQAMACAVPL